MKVTKHNIEGLLEIEPDVFEDSRGYFYESYNEEKFHEIGIKAKFIQDNQSKSERGVLRGLHFQNPPFAQGKLIRVIKGSVLDVVVDLRKDSSTYGKHYKTILSEKNKKSLWIPHGFAHGFLTLEDETIFTYKVDQYYNKDSEGCIMWNDKTLNIDWGLGDSIPIISEKDKLGIDFAQFNTSFIK